MASALHSNLKQTEAKGTDINILLLGETGVGKSTFINSFVNYLQHTSLNNAKKAQLISLIPSRFTIPDEDFKDRIIEFGYDENEDVEIGNSSTQGARAYVFPFENRNIRLIDTPGIGDARGINQDGINFENVLSYINQFEYLHAVCFLLKPNVSVINAYFKFCIMHLLSRLEKSAANNIIFIFTNSRSTFYKPGESLPVLKRILKEIQDSPPHVEIPCIRKNMFCVDNEAFKFLVALKQKIKFGDHEMKEFSNSWERSYNTCREIISYICGDETNAPLPPHAVQNTISVNEARRNIINLSKPLADVCELIQDNITILKRHEEAIQQDNLSKTELTAKLYVPIIELNVQVLQQPVTVCTASKCSEIYTVEGMNKYHYKQRCHKPCYLTNVPKEIIGTPELRNCAAMCGPTCTRCGCDFSAHMHIYYQTEITNSKQEDKSVKRYIRTKEDAIMAKNAMVLKLTQVSAEYEHEKKEISKCMAKFAHFLKENSISIYNDAYVDYLDYLIEREKMLGFQKDRDRINHYMSLKKHYEQEKRILDESMQNARISNRNAIIVTPVIVLGLVKDLYKLPHTGKKIECLHSIQQHSVQNTIKSTEYRHPTLMSSTEYESSSSDGEKSRSQDWKIIESLMKEDNLEAMRLKLKNIKLNESDEDEIDDKKQKIWNFVSQVFKGAEGKDSEINVNSKKKSGNKTNRERQRNNSGVRTKETYESDDSQHRRRDNRFQNVHRGQSGNRYGDRNQQRQPSNSYGNNNQRQHDNRYPGNYQGQPGNQFNNQGQPGNQFNNQGQPFIPPLMQQAGLQYVPNQFAMNSQYQQNTPNFIPPLLNLQTQKPAYMGPNQFHPNFQASGSTNFRGNYNNRRGGNAGGQRGSTRGKMHNTTFKKRTSGHQNNHRQSDASNRSSSDSDEDEPKVNQNKNFSADFVKQFMETYNIDKSKSGDKSSVFMFYEKK